jgi:hypothetical protein
MLFAPHVLYRSELSNNMITYESSSSSCRKAQFSFLSLYLYLLYPTFLLVWGSSIDSTSIFSDVEVCLVLSSINIFPTAKKENTTSPPSPQKKDFYFFSNRPAGRPTLTNVLAGTTKCWRPTPRIVYSTHSLPFFLVAAIVLSFWLVVSNLNRRQGHCWLQGERVPCLAWWMELSKSQSLFYFILAVEVWTRKSLTKSPVFGKRKKKKKFQIWRRPAQADGRGPGVGDK